MPDTKALLTIEDVRVEHDGVPAVHEVSLEVKPHELVGLVGANGAGKTSLLRSIAGDLSAAAGRVIFSGTEITHSPAHTIADLGISHVPEGRRLFGPLTVAENLRLGAFRTNDRHELQGRMQRVTDLFPVLGTRLKQRAETLSGGEQQMLAVARGLMSNPSLLLVDELSLGVMPSVVATLYELLNDLTSHGISVLVADQNVSRLLEISDRAYVMQTGHIVATGSGAELLASPEVKRAYLGM